MSLNPATSTPGCTPVYSAVWMSPNRVPDASASRAISAAHSGATALVPPTTCGCPSAMIWYPVSGSAFPATSGTPRPAACEVPAETGTPAVACHEGTGKASLTPPPPAPPPDPSFHTVSDEMTPAAVATRLVPPQASACGDEAGKSTCGCPSVTPSED